MSSSQQGKSSNYPTVKEIVSFVIALSPQLLNKIRLRLGNPASNSQPEVTVKKEHQNNLHDGQ
jgi:hypothetical protein